MELIWQKEERARLAESIQNQLVKILGRKDRGVAQSNFTVLVKPDASALAEVSFISNPTENELLCNKNYQERSRGYRQRDPEYQVNRNPGDQLYF